MDFKTKFASQVQAIDEALDRYVPASAEARGPRRIHEAMRYSLQAGGKRIRPVLLLSAAELFSPDPERTTFALVAAVAVECIHTYSLVHDDLPAMDDDDLRRGRPTAHRQFDEATAVLAGDALLTHAFYLLATHYGNDPRLCVDLVRELSTIAGSHHLIGGQMEDMLAENSVISPRELEFIHLNKTAAMIEASLVMGGLVGGADHSQTPILRQYGRHLGLAFQIIDDILDATSDADTLGKTPGKDAAANKATFVTLHGLDTARKLAEEHTQSAIAQVDKLPGNVDFLRQLTHTMLARKA